MVKYYCRSWSRASLSSHAVNCVREMHASTYQNPFLDEIIDH